MTDNKSLQPAKMRTVYVVSKMLHWSSLVITENGSHLTMAADCPGFMPVYLTKKALRATHGEDCEYWCVQVPAHLLKKMLADTKRKETD